MDQDAFERKLVALNETFHLQELILLVVETRDLRIRKQRLNAPECSSEFVRIVSANDSPAGREPERLEYARILGAPSGRVRPIGERDALELGHKQSGGSKLFARQKFIAAREDRVRRIVGNPHELGGEGGDISRTVPHRDDSVHFGFRRDGASRAFRIFEAQRQRVVSPRIVEHVASIGGERQLKAQTFGRLGEDTGLIAGGGADQQQASFIITHPTTYHPPPTTYTRATCSSVGSAQQYQGSSIYGMVARGISSKLSGKG